jgi:hypothetical protein
MLAFTWKTTMTVWSAGAGVCKAALNIWGASRSLLTHGSWTNQPSNDGISWPVPQGSWLLVIPDCLNGNSLSAEEFCDNLRLRYNLLPLDMPQLCNGCGALMTIEHALCCKVGGLVHIRHDNVTGEWCQLCGCALTFGRVKRVLMGTLLGTIVIVLVAWTKFCYKLGVR